MSNITEYTFASLIGAKVIIEENGKEKSVEITDIEIPRIQRDYAQGRTSKEVTKIRTRFLKSIYESVTTKTHMTLDFVYGDIEKSVHPEKEEPQYVLTPLDGQQRLTTLFLIHWFIAKKNKIDTSEYEFLKHFSYATRFSSRDFCKELIDYSPDFDNLLKKKVDDSDEEVISLSYTIKDQSWYQFEWNNDPTIQSMLVMLDSIYELFNKEKNLWINLKESIGFYFLSLHRMGLSDELYIKMNSRGKPLTPFEHFKADFESLIKPVSDELYNYFNHHFDVEWADVFFPYRGENKIIDDEMLRYFKFASSILCYEQELNYEDDEYRLAELLYGNGNSLRKENIEFLKNCFDCLMNEKDLKVFFESTFTKDIYEEGKVKIFYPSNLFEECCNLFGEYSGRNRKFPLNEYILFYGTIIYFQNKDKVNIDDFKFRIRIIRNLVWNSAFEIRDDKPQRMKNILEETKNIILTGKLSPFEDGKINFSTYQKSEENEKIAWYEAEKDENFRKELLQLESNSLLKGCIAVIGLENKNNFNGFLQLFENSEIEYDVINRAMLSICDYSQFIGWRYQIGSWTNDSAWIDLFHPSEQRPGFKNTKHAINTLIEKNPILNNETLNKFADDYLNSDGTVKDWRYYIIKYPSMREGKFGMYYWWDKTKEKQYEVIMMNTEKSIGGYNWELFSYCLLGKYPDKLSMGNYSYNGDKLLIKGKNIIINFRNDSVDLIKDDTVIYTLMISQDKSGNDMVDRIELTEELIKKYF